MTKAEKKALKAQQAAQAVQVAEALTPASVLVPAAEQATPAPEVAPADAPSPAPVAAPTPVNRMVTVCAQRTLNEDGRAYAPGMKFATSPERAAALGALVKVEEPAPAK